MKYKVVFLFLAIAFVFLSGCLDIDHSNPGKDKSFRAFANNMLLSKTYGSEHNLDCKDLGCKCLYCKRIFLSEVTEGTFFSEYTTDTSEINLLGMECNTLYECNEDKFKDIYNNMYEQQEDGTIAFNENKFIERFFVGQGPGVGALKEATGYCDATLGLSTKWLEGYKGKYEVPFTKPLTCLLSNNVFPMYILYSKDKVINQESIASAKKIAKIIDEHDDTWYEVNYPEPVMIVSDIAISDMPKEQRPYSLIKAEIAGMKQECPACLIGLGIKYGDEDTLNALLSDNSLKDQLSFVAVGIDNRDIYQKSSVCTPGQDLAKAYDFSRSISTKYGLPVIWAYVLMDNKYVSADKQCVWSKKKTAEFFRKMFYNVPLFSSKGILGFSLYSLAGNGPLECADCRLSKDPQDDAFKSWFNFCKAFYASPFQTPLAVYSPGYSDCSFAARASSEWLYNLPSEDQLEPVEYNDHGFKCSVCLYDLDDFPLNGISQLYMPMIFTGDDGSCTEDHPVAYEALARDIDPEYMRALAYAISQGEQCFPDSTNDRDQDVCNSLYVSSYVDQGGCGSFESSLFAQPPGKYKCGFGIFGLKPNDDYSKYSCNKDLFKEEDSACLASSIFSDYLSDSLEGLTNALATLPDSKKQELSEYFTPDVINVITYLVATEKYFHRIGWDHRDSNGNYLYWRDSYFNQYALNLKGTAISCNDGSTLSNEKNFVKFLDCKGLKWGKEVMGYYRYLTENNMCSGDNKLSCMHED